MTEITPSAPVKPWTRLQFAAALRRAGWKKMKGSVGGTYISPDDPTVLFSMYNYRAGFGIAWECFAVRCELPSTTRPPF
ncbi:hypothetical protein [Thauera sp.]|uniref:hypothetical protein n=1 Tax=Thauera sp. TaxID=1905334 RepID=UPI002C6561F6|nr:hypothetical protein [Thauera sp.]HRP25969.1 hypothetical protein [Thauera sp.]